MMACAGTGCNDWSSRVHEKIWAVVCDHPADIKFTGMLHAKVSYYVDGFGYSYILPTSDWYDNKFDAGMEMYGPEGTIEIEFIPVDQGHVITDTISGLLQERVDASDYVRQEVDASNVIIFAKSGDAGSEETPSHLAVRRVGERVAVVRGFQERGMAARFSEFFTEIVLSLEPLFVPPTRSSLP